jgi:hypothetical protein
LRDSNEVRAASSRCRYSTTGGGDRVAGSRYARKLATRPPEAETGSPGLDTLAGSLLDHRTGRPGRLAPLRHAQNTPQDIF